MPVGSNIEAASSPQNQFKCLHMNAETLNASEFNIVQSGIKLVGGAESKQSLLICELDDMMHNFLNKFHTFS